LQNSRPKVSLDLKARLGSIKGYSAQLEADNSNFFG